MRVERESKSSQSKAPAAAIKGPQIGRRQASGLSMLGLQATAGNRAVCRLLGVQAKMDVGPADDPHEREADLVARAVNQAIGMAQRSDSEITPIPQNIVRTVQRRPKLGAAGGQLDEASEQMVRAELGGGRPLAAGVRRQMEAGFGADFSAVRVHADGRAAELNDRMGAKAFTYGSDIFFRGPAADTGGSSDNELLAHELTHVVQQGAAARTAQRSPEDELQRSPEDELQRSPEDESKSAESEEAEPSSSSAGLEEEAKQAGEAEGSESEDEKGGDFEFSGEVPASEFGPPDKEETGLAPPVEADAARPGRSGQAPVRKARNRSLEPGAATELAIEVGRVGISSTTEQTPSVPHGSIRDAVTPKASIKVDSPTQVPETEPFGGLTRWWDVENTSFKVKEPKKQETEGVVTINVAMRLGLEWGMTGGTCIDVPSGDSSVVTADNYQQISNDLTPKAKQGSWVAPRSTYWSEALTKRHELFHARDVSTWAKKEAKSSIVSFLNGRKIALTADERKDEDKVKDKVKQLVEDAKDQLKNDTNVYMRGVGKTYYDYPTEVRAYGDGKNAYTKLAADAVKRGKSLERAKEKAAKKKVGSGAA